MRSGQNVSEERFIYSSPPSSQARGKRPGKTEYRQYRVSERQSLMSSRSRYSKYAIMDSTPERKERKRMMITSNGVTIIVTTP